MGKTTKGLNVASRAPKISIIIHSYDKKYCNIQTIENLNLSDQ